MRGIIRFGLLCALASAMVLSHPETTRAVEESQKESITLSPVKKVYKLDPGSTTADELTIVNDGVIDYTFTVYTRPYSVKDEQYQPDFFTVKTNTDIDSWVKFPQKSYLVKAGETKVIPYSITVPVDAIPGGHYGVVFAETQPQAAKPTSNLVERKKRVGSLIYATVNGDFKSGGTFGPVDIPYLQFKSPLIASVTVENSGDSDFAVDTVYAVSDLFGNRKYTESKQFQVLPRTKRLIQLAWKESPGFGIYQVTASARFADQTTSKTTYVLMAPLLYYMVFVVGLLVAVIYFVAKRRR